MWRDAGTSLWNEDVIMLEACWITGGNYVDVELVDAIKDDLAECGRIFMANRNTFHECRPK